MLQRGSELTGPRSLFLPVGTGATLARRGRASSKSAPFRHLDSDKHFRPQEINWEKSGREKWKICPLAGRIMQSPLPENSREFKMSSLSPSNVYTFSIAHFSSHRKPFYIKRVPATQGALHCPRGPAESLGPPHLQVTRVVQPGPRGEPKTRRPSSW